MSNKNNVETHKKLRKKYVLKEKHDLEILALCNELEAKRLSKSNRKLVKLIKTQLEEDWRTPLLNVLKKIEKNIDCTF